MTMRTIIRIVPLAVCLVSAAAFACGDKLVALGGGIQFERVMVSRHPSRIAVLLSPASGLEGANREFNLVASLTLVGHDVTVVASHEELDALLEHSRQHLVLVDYADTARMFRRTAAVVSMPDVLPVLVRPTAAELRAAEREIGCIAEISSRSDRKTLRRVEELLEARSKNKRLPCEHAVLAQTM